MSGALRRDSLSAGTLRSTSGIERRSLFGDGSDTAFSSSAFLFLLSLNSSAIFTSWISLLVFFHLVIVASDSTVIGVAIALRCSWRFLLAALAFRVERVKSLLRTFGAALVESFISFLAAAASGLFLGGFLLLCTGGSVVCRPQRYQGMLHEHSSCVARPFHRQWVQYTVL